MQAATMTSEFLQSGIAAASGDKTLTESLGGSASPQKKQAVQYFAAGGYAVGSIEL